MFMEQCRKCIQGLNQRHRFSIRLGWNLILFSLCGGSWRAAGNTGLLLLLACSLTFSPTIYRMLYSEHTNIDFSIFFF